MSETPRVADPDLALDAVGFMAIIDERLPFARIMQLAVDRFDAEAIVLRSRYTDDFLRPGGTIAGPILMGLADAAMYAAVLSRIGPVELAVTTSLGINFLRKPAPRDVLAEPRLLKLGKRLAVGEVTLWSDGDSPEHAVAHVTATYSIPPPESRHS